MDLLEYIDDKVERTNSIIDSLEPLYKQAYENNLWFYCRYQNLWFAPDELKKEQSEGRFVWGVPNWELRNPIEEVHRIADLIDNTKKQLSEFVNRVNESRK